VKLTTDNIARVEAMIMTDFGYAKSGDVNRSTNDSIRTADVGLDGAYYLFTLKQYRRRATQLNQYWAV
ncbi:MAG: hypothetical protein RR342_02890, partial [Bacilli bacterium]